jgi:nucleotide-binding universal stress UspA family protein
MKILVAADGSSHTKRMLAYLAAHEEWLGPAHHYTVLYCSPPLPPRAAAYCDREALRAFYAKESEKVFKPIRSFFARHDMKASFTEKVGQPAEAIAAFAEKGRFDLLAMGSHGHGPLGNVVMGSVVTKVLAHCKTPLLIIR